MNRSNREKGSAFVEFALVFLVLFTVFAGAFEFGYAFYGLAPVEIKIAEESSCA